MPAYNLAGTADLRVQRTLRRLRHRETTPPLHEAAAADENDGLTAFGERELARATQRTRWTACTSPLASVVFRMRARSFAAENIGSPLLRRLHLSLSDLLCLLRAALLSSDKRQLEAITAFAKRAGFQIVATCYADVRGADPIDTRAQFAQMLDMLLTNGTRTIIVETPSRFSCDLITQKTGWALLKAQGSSLVAADSPDAFLDETPTAVLITQVLGAVSQFEKAMVVSKLKDARDR